MFQYFGVSKKIEQEGGSIKIFRRKFLSHSAKYYRRGSLQCCNRFGFRKNSDKSGGVGRGYQDFPSNFFCLTVPKTFVGESFCAVFQKNSHCGKIYG